MIEYPNVTEQVSAHIRKMIRNGELQPGERLRLTQLAGSLGVSIMPVREALRELQAEGLVVIHPRRGAMVARLSVEEFLELDSIIEALELLACQWLAEDFGRLPLHDLRSVLAELEEAESSHDISRRLRLMRQFRFIIYNAAGRPHLVRIISNLYDMTAHYRRVFSEVVDIHPIRIEHYRSILRACEAQDLNVLRQSVRALYAFASSVIVSHMEPESLRRDHLDVE